MATEKINIFKKLQQARVDFLKESIKKSGNNKFVGFNYFELADIIPAIAKIFDERGLCDITTFDAEYAYLHIYDTDASQEPSEGYTHITFKAPLGSANIKGAHEIQNIGAVQTYHRRYLLALALNIVEHDALDASLKPGEESKEPDVKKASKPTIKNTLSSILHNMIKDGDVEAAYGKYMEYPLEERAEVFNQLDKDSRQALLKYKSQLEEL